MLAVPLILTGVHLSKTAERMHDEAWRPNGFWNPPENPWLREEDKPRMHTRAAAGQVWKSYAAGLLGGRPPPPAAGPQ